METTKKLRPHHALLILVALAVGLAACGGNDTSGTPRSATTRVDATGSDAGDQSDAADAIEEASDALSEVDDALGSGDVREPDGHQQLQLVNATDVALEVTAAPNFVDDEEAEVIVTIEPGTATGFIEVPYWGFITDDFQTTLWASGADYPVGSGGFIFDAGFGDDTRNFVVLYDDAGTVRAQGGTPNGYPKIVAPETPGPSGQAGVGLLGFPDGGGIFPNPFLLTDGAPGTCPDQRSGVFVNGIDLVFVEPGPVELNLYPDDRTDACEGPAPAVLTGSLDAGRLYVFIVTGPSDYSDLKTLLVPIT